MSSHVVWTCGSMVDTFHPPTLMKKNPLKAFMLGLHWKPDFQYFGHNAWPFYVSFTAPTKLTKPSIMVSMATVVILQMYWRYFYRSEHHWKVSLSEIHAALVLHLMCLCVDKQHLEFHTCTYGTLEFQQEQVKRHNWNYVKNGENRYTHWTLECLPLSSDCWKYELFIVKLQRSKHKSSTSLILENVIRQQIFILLQLCLKLNASWHENRFWWSTKFDPERH